LEVWLMLNFERRGCWWCRPWASFEILELGTDDAGASGKFLANSRKLFCCFHLASWWNDNGAKALNCAIAVSFTSSFNVEVGEGYNDDFNITLEPLRLTPNRWLISHRSVVWKCPWSLFCLYFAIVCAEC
jgi:hypothetical protein